MRDTTHDIDPADPFAAFHAALAAGGDSVDTLRAGLIGDGLRIDGPFGPQPLVYADYTASGRALMPVERFMLEEVLPYYANSHTEASFCGAFMTRLRRAARQVVAHGCGAGPDHAVVFCGAGATAGVNRLVHLLGAGPGTRVLLGPYEHHSNILPWRDSGAEVIEIVEGPEGGPDPEHLAAALADSRGAARVICAFSAASNITGILADVPALTRQVKAAGACMVWDYAGGAPYLPIAMTPAPDAAIDALVLSPHKFPGGPGASGVMVLRREAVRTDAPSWTGGGTVRFVSSDAHDYTDSLEAREEAGTPNGPADIRAALAFLVKAAIGQTRMDRRHAELCARIETAWRDHPRLQLLGAPGLAGLPIASFRLRDGRGGHVHQQLVTRLLSDRFGIQARGGCACAGPYVHRLLDIDAAQSARLRAAILNGDEVAKPGFTRLNLSVLMTDEKVDYILQAVRTLADTAPDLAKGYTCDPARAIFTPRPDRSASRPDA
ncbi:aminotransferase class V-fold PLP-dependent enzyme [Pararhodobacter sp. SW119]|uniref:aminotransferase class V-fold PLP-dependent enzyme n=1 Tax=Pararhodobacter sp. SW119 TaxID=2780075 RepID=UPI001AE06D3F|nr:aminotransferase class V-fold PLP-dependent enzyme [Pararhodobacter sp. SW119]